MIFDRGCFHVMSPERRGEYLATVSRLIAPRGYLFVKTFSHLQPGTEGPHRFTADEIRETFRASSRFSRSWTPFTKANSIRSRRHSLRFWRRT